MEALVGKKQKEKQQLEEERRLWKEKEGKVLDEDVARQDRGLGLLASLS